MRKPISRRALLRGAGGVAISLPFLEAMLPRRAAHAAPAPRRFLVWSLPNGSVINRWAPQAGTSETDFTLSEILSPLERHKSDLVVLQNISQTSGYGHQLITSLTGRPYVDEGYPKLYSMGQSLDQYLAGTLGKDTPIPALLMGVATEGEGTAGLASWTGPREGLAPEADPFKVFARLFTNGTEQASDATRALLARKKSVLDSVGEQTARLQSRLGRADQRVLGNYLDSVRELDKQITALADKADRCAPPPEFAVTPEGRDGTPWYMIVENDPKTLELEMKLAVAAFACDLTRVITLKPARSDRIFPYVADVDPKNVDWHGHSHSVETGVEGSMAAIEKYHYGQLANLIDGLKGVTDVDGETLLKNTLVFVNNEYGANSTVNYLEADDNGNRNNLTHQVHLMPYVLLGQSGGTLRTGRNLVYPLENKWVGSGQNKHTQLLVSMLNLLGLPDQTFGDPTAPQGPLPDLI